MSIDNKACDFSRGLFTYRQEVIETLKRHRQDLARRYGVKSLALFGSVARGGATERSDVDLLVEFDGCPVGLLHLIGMEQHIAQLLGGAKVDLVLKRALIEELKAPILKEAVDVFPGDEVEIPPAPHAGGG